MPRRFQFSLAMLFVVVGAIAYLITAFRGINGSVQDVKAFALTQVLIVLGALGSALWLAIDAKRRKRQR